MSRDEAVQIMSDVADDPSSFERGEAAAVLLAELGERGPR